MDFKICYRSFSYSAPLALCSLPVSRLLAADAAGSHSYYFQPQFAIPLSHSMCVCAVATNNGFKLELKDFLLCSLENCDEIHDYFSTFQFITNLWAIFRFVVLQQRKPCAHSIPSGTGRHISRCINISLAKSNMDF